MTYTEIVARVRLRVYMCSCVRGCIHVNGRESMIRYVLRFSDCSEVTE